MDVSLSKLQEIMRDKEAHCATVRRVAKRHSLVTEQEQQWRHKANLWCPGSANAVGMAANAFKASVGGMTIGP